jgi:hypothetical protein
LRKAIVFAQKNGELLCISIDKQCVDWQNEWKDDAIFNADKVFDFPLWRDNEKKVWETYVKESDQIGLGG